MSLFVESGNEFPVEEAEGEQGTSMNHKEVEEVAVDDTKPFGTSQLAEVEVVGGGVESGVPVHRLGWFGVSLN